MAYRSRRSAVRRSAPSRSRYGSGGRTGSRRPARRSTGNRRSVSRQQTVKLVVEMAPPSAVARPEGVPQVEVQTKRSKF